MTGRVPGVIVLGMHRSGTSAVAGSLIDSGLHACLPADLLAASPDNASGHWESLAINAENDAVLAAAVHTWQAPPDPSADWTAARPVRRREALARSTFEWLHPRKPWLVKDPRLCLTLPFWLRALGTEPAVVIVLRHPSAIARSLSTRDGIAVEEGLMLCELYTRSAMTAAAGLMALVVRYEDVVRAPGAWRAASVAFLGRAGLVVDQGDSDHSPGVEPGLQHWTDTDSSSMTLVHQAVWESSISLLGSHASLPRIALP